MEKPKVSEPLSIPTREEQSRYIRRLWKMCIIMASLVFLVASSAFFGMLYSGTKAAVVVNISTGIFQLIVLSYGLAFFVPAFLTSLYRLGLGIEMSRAGLEVGQKTAEVLEKVQDEGMELITEVREIITEVNVIMEEIRPEGELRKRIDRIGVSLEKAAGVIASPVKLKVPASRPNGPVEESVNPLVPREPKEEAAP